MRRAPATVAVKDAQGNCFADKLCSVITAEWPCISKDTTVEDLQQAKEHVQGMASNAISLAFEGMLLRKQQASSSMCRSEEFGVQCELDQENLPGARQGKLKELQLGLKEFEESFRLFEFKMCCRLDEFFELIRVASDSNLKTPEPELKVVEPEAKSTEMLRHPISYPSSNLLEGETETCIVNENNFLHSFNVAAQEMRHLEDSMEQKKYPHWIAPVIVPCSEWIKKFGNEPEPADPIRKCVETRCFELICLIVIMCNSLWVIFETNMRIYNVGIGEPSYVFVVNTLFTSMFAVEIVLKLLAHRLYFFINDSWNWNLLDFGLVALGLIDLVLSTSINPIHLRIVRLVRVFKIVRVFRLMRGFTELRLLLKCIAGSFVHLLWSLMMLALFTTMYAVILVQHISAFLDSSAGAKLASADKSKLLKCFGSVEISTLSLFKSISGGQDWDDYFSILQVTGFVCPLLFLCFLLFIWLAMANIITSLYVEKAMKLAQPDVQELLSTKHKEDLDSAHELSALFSRLDATGNGSLSHDEFMKCMDDYKVKEYFEMRGLAFKDTEIFFRLLSSLSEDSEVNIDTFVGGCLKMKGLALNVDLLSLQYELRGMYQSQKKMNNQFLKEIRQISHILNGTLASGCESKLHKFRRNSGASQRQKKYTISL